MTLLSTKVAVVTGAGRGLGAAYAKLLAQEGAAVVVNDIGRNEDGSYIAETTAEAIRQDGGKATAHTQDVSSVEGGKSLLDTALENFGAVDILINNAGILRDKSLLKMDEPDWDLVIKVNLKSMYAVTKPIFSWMKENSRSGVIVNTSSVSALAGNFGQANYGASKGGVWGFSNVLAIEGAKYGIRVWTLAPAALSALTAPLLSDEMKQELAPEHVAQAVLFTVSELSGKRTGHCLFASGQSIKELKLVAAEGIPGGGKDASLDARRMAVMQDRIFREEPALTIMDFSK